MTGQARPRRSVLYMPGSNARALEKGRDLPADGLILDLEDAVAPDAKETARRQVGEALTAGGYGRRELVVRVNGLDTPWGADDVRAASKFGAHALLLPKVESEETVRRAEAMMEEWGAPDGLAIWCMIETPQGVLKAHEVATSSPRVQCLVMGTSDLAKDLGCAHTRDRLPLLASLGLCLLAARGARVAILDGVHLDLADDEGFQHACRQGKEMGFDGKTLIHPKTIAAANRVFAPSADEIAWSRKIIAAHAEAERQGKGVAVVDGKLVESLHVQAAKRLVALAESIAEAELGTAA